MTTENYEIATVLLARIANMKVQLDNINQNFDSCEVVFGQQGEDDRVFNESFDVSESLMDSIQLSIKNYYEEQIATLKQKFEDL